MTGLEFHPEAESELLAAAQHYEGLAANLGLDFVAAVEATCERVLRFPEIGYPFGAKLRRVLVPRFPFGLVYRIESDRLLVIAVANLYRRPGYWRSRG